MPPEYRGSGAISTKFDVFSLGVTIIKIMAGNTGHSNFYEMSPKQFIELVRETILQILGNIFHVMCVIYVLLISRCMPHLSNFISQSHR